MPRHRRPRRWPASRPPRRSARWPPKASNCTAVSRSPGNTTCSCISNVRTVVRNCWARPASTCAGWNPKCSRPATMQWGHLQPRSGEGDAQRDEEEPGCSNVDRMTDHVALRAGIPPFYVMDVWLAAAERQGGHGDLVNLSAGQPSAGAPEPVRAAAASALHLNQLGYTVALGIPELRAGIAASYPDRYGVQVEMDDVVVTTGSSGGFLLAFLSCFDVGDRVAVSSPGYPCYRNILTALGCEVVVIECGPETRFQPTAQMLAELAPPVRGVVVASPANPTGTVIPPAELAAIASWCDESEVRLISDEVYHGLVYDGAPQTSCAWSTSRNAVVVNSFSKYFAMTGWRLGWLLVPTALRRAVDRLTGNFTICPPVLSQHAAVAAFTPEAVDEANGHLHQYAVNRATLLDGLRSIGIDRLAPTDGAFYVYADVSDFTGDSMAFCSKLLADTGVAIAPGIDLDPARGGSYVRLSFAGPAGDIDEALRRMGSWLQSR